MTTTSADHIIDSHDPPPVAEEFDGEGIKENKAVLKFISDMLMDDDSEIEQHSLHPDHYSLSLLQAMNTTTTSADQTIDSHVPAPVAEEFDGESIKENETVLKFINDMLMEDDDDNFQNEPSALHHNHCSSADYLLQATEKSLYDALIDRSSDFVEQPIQTLVLLPDSSAANNDTTPVVKQKNRHREADVDFLTTHIPRINKQPAITDDDDEEPLEMYDDVMLYTHVSGQRRRSRKPKNNNKSLPAKGKKEVVDLRSLLMQCAQAMDRFDSKAATDLLYLIRKHSSPLGTASERVAHYLANALEARLSGTGKAMLRASTAGSSRTLCRGVLKSLRMCITSCPFMTMSNLFTKSTIANLVADDVATVHVIDFGIMFGFQWPCLIQALSERPGGPPKLRITGIDNPLPGFRPAERVLHTGAQLAKYCERFGVPFEYNGIAMAWDRIRIEDLNLGGEGEMVVVCSLYRLHELSDKEAGSARDAVLRLIRRVEPRVFVHGIVNGAYQDTPFFVPRFKEALSYYYAMFDLLEATVPPDEEGQIARVGFEEVILGGGVMKVIGCEGPEIVENRETYRQWGRRSRRIGFRQLPVEREIVRRTEKLKSSYHKEFSVSEDDNWVLLEWKGRVVYAFSSWEPGNAY